MVQYKLSELIARFGGKLEGEDVTVTGIAPTNLAKDGEITFISDKKFKNSLSDCRASAIIITDELVAQSTLNIPKIIVADAYLYFSYVSSLFHPRAKLKNEIKKAAIIASTAIVGENCAISDKVVIGENSQIGNNCQFYPGVVIGSEVVIGNNVVLYPNVVIYSNVTIGDGTVIHAGSVIGSDGFGYAKNKDLSWQKIPQIGGVKIGNNVEIGANTTIDCGTFAPTIIEDGVIIDNLVQIAHNVVIGAHSAIASCVGIAGSTKVGKYCTLAGGSGLNGHIEICDHTVIGGRTSIAKSITKPDLYFGVYPATTYGDWARSATHLKNLTALNQKVKDLEQKLVKLIEDVDNG